MAFILPNNSQFIWTLFSFKGSLKKKKKHLFWSLNKSPWNLSILSLILELIFSHISLRVHVGWKWWWEARTHSEEADMSSPVFAFCRLFHVCPSLQCEWPRGHRALPERIRCAELCFPNGSSGAAGKCAELASLPPLESSLAQTSAKSSVGRAGIQNIMFPAR